MRKKLGLIAIAGFGACVLCLGGAFALGGGGLGDADFGVSNPGSASCAFVPGGSQASRTLAWRGGDAIVIAVPAVVTWRAGDGDAIRATGDADLLPHLRVSGGRLMLDCNLSHWGKARLAVSLPGRQIFRKYELRGADEMHLSGLDQSALEISVRGAGQIDAEGKADRVGVDLRGAGDIDLGHVTAQNASVSIRGTGHVSIAPRDTAKVEIRGAGNVRLVTEPKHVQSDIRGFGSIEHPSRQSRAAPATDHFAARDPDDALYDAKQRLKARIKANVAAAIANAPI